MQQRYLTNATGLTAVEVSATLPLFLLVILLGLDLLRVLFLVLTFQSALSEGSRFASLGTASTSEIEERIMLTSFHNLESPEISICPAASVVENTNCPSESAGGAGEWMFVGINTEIVLVSAHTSIPINLSAFIKNEP